MFQSTCLCLFATKFASNVGYGSFFFSFFCLINVAPGGISNIHSTAASFQPKQIWTHEHLKTLNFSLSMLFNSHFKINKIFAVVGTSCSLRFGKCKNMYDTQFLEAINFRKWFKRSHLSKIICWLLRLYALRYNLITVNWLPNYYLNALFIYFFRSASSCEQKFIIFCKFSSRFLSTRNLSAKIEFSQQFWRIVNLDWSMRKMSSNVKFGD